MTLKDYCELDISKSSPYFRTTLDGKYKMICQYIYVDTLK